MRRGTATRRCSNSDAETAACPAFERLHLSWARPRVCRQSSIRWAICRMHLGGSRGFGQKLPRLGEQTVACVFGERVGRRCLPGPTSAPDRRNLSSITCQPRFELGPSSVDGRGNFGRNTLADLGQDLFDPWPNSVNGPRANFGRFRTKRCRLRATFFPRLADSGSDVVEFGQTMGKCGRFLRGPTQAEFGPDMAEFGPNSSKIVRILPVCWPNSARMPRCGLKWPPPPGAALGLLLGKCSASVGGLRSSPGSLGVTFREAGNHWAAFG